MPNSSPEPGTTPGGDQPSATRAAIWWRSSRYPSGSEPLPTASVSSRPSSTTSTVTPYTASPVPVAVGSSARSRWVPAASPAPAPASAPANSCQAWATLAFRSALAASSSTRAASGSSSADMIASIPSAIPYPGGADADIMPSVPGGEQTGDRDLTVFIRLNRRRCSAGRAAPPDAGDLGRSYPRQGAEASKISESLVRPTGRPGVSAGGAVVVRLAAQGGLKRLGAPAPAQRLVPARTVDVDHTVHCGLCGELRAEPADGVGGQEREVRGEHRGFRGPARRVDGGGRARRVDGGGRARRVDGGGRARRVDGGGRARRVDGGEARGEG